MGNPRRNAPARLHIGSAEKRLDGWLNVDRKPLPGVDVVADVTDGLRFSDVEAIFAEHFIEHLAIEDAFGFLVECHRIMRPGAWLRLSTPNLDWVWQTHYRLEAPAEEKRLMALRLNRAFHGWGHRFLWNREMLGEALASCGFEGVRWCRYGESELEIFRGLEQHETYGDHPDLPHVIIAEARRGTGAGNRLRELKWIVGRELLDHLAS